MTPIDYLIIFASSFANVFLLGFQSKNVQRSRYLLAGMTSLGITIASYTFVKYSVTGDMLSFLAVSSIGGSLGIMAAIYAHDAMEKKRCPK